MLVVLGCRVLRACCSEVSDAGLEVVHLLVPESDQSFEHTFRPTIIQHHIVPFPKRPMLFLWLLLRSMFARLRSS